MTYRLLALDLDGTLLTREKRVSPRTREAIDRAAERGLKIVVATGRSFAVARYFADGITLNAPQITYNGAIVYDPIAGCELSRFLLPPACVRPGIDFFAQAGIHVAVFATDGVYMTDRMPNPASWLPGQPVSPMLLRDIRDVDADRCIKVVGHADAMTIARLRPLAVERFGADLYVTETSPTLLELLHPEVSKGAALRRIAHALHIDRGDVIAFGDSHNDVEMLAFAGVGVAMGNASPEVREMADLVTASNEHDGIAEALCRLGVV